MLFLYASASVNWLCCFELIVNCCNGSFFFFFILLLFGVCVFYFFFVRVYLASVF